MLDIIRDSALGATLRFVSKRKLAAYPEDNPDFQIPSAYSEKNNASLASISNGSILEKPSGDLERAPSIDEPLALRLSRTRSQLPGDRLHLEASLAIERTKSQVIEPQKTRDGVTIVDWYTTDDPENPKNWSGGKKASIAIIISIYTFVFYCGSAIYLPSEQGIMEKFNVKATIAALGLSLYVLAYGIGPLLFSPLSEIPTIGRNIPYITTFGIYLILCIPTPMVNNLPGLLVLRFLQGFFGSPCLASGGASMQDMYDLIQLPYLLTLWVSSAFCGPALGPLLSGYAVTAKGWRWSLWEMLWMAAPTFIAMFVFLPETSSNTILLRRAQRLRKLTGSPNYLSQSEIDQAKLKLTPSAILKDAIIKPLEITIKDPAVLFTNIYTAFIYGIYYSFFESFPLVFIGMHNMTIGMVGVVFTCILVSCILGVITYLLYYYFYLERDIIKNGLREQEHRLVPALFAIFGPTIGLFIVSFLQSLHCLYHAESY